MLLILVTGARSSSSRSPRRHQTPYFYGARCELAIVTRSCRSRGRLTLASMPQSSGSSIKQFPVQIACEPAKPLQRFEQLLAVAGFLHDPCRAPLTANLLP